MITKLNKDNTTVSVDTHSGTVRYSVDGVVVKVEHIKLSACSFLVSKLQSIGFVAVKRVRVSKVLVKRKAVQQAQCDNIKKWFVDYTYNHTPEKVYSITCVALTAKQAESKVMNSLMNACCKNVELARVCK